MGQLSSEEEQTFSQIVEGLTKEDASFTKKVTRQQLHPRALFYGILGGLVGVALLFVGLMSQMWWISVVGFSVMTAGGYFASYRFSRGIAKMRRGENPQRRVAASALGKEKFSQRFIRWSLGNSLRTQKEAWRYRRKVGVIAIGLVVLGLFIPLPPLRVISMFAILYAFYVVLATGWMLAVADDDEDDEDRY